MTHAEMIEWAAAFEIEPWGDLREDVRHSIRCAVAANTAFGSRGNAKAEDFIPKFGPARRMSPDEVKSRFAAYAAGTTAARNR